MKHKKSHSILCGTTQERVNFAITELRGHPARKVCKILQIPRSSYYDTRRNSVRRKAYKVDESRTVCDKFIEHHGSFGRRALKRLLQQDGICISEYKISRILKKNGYRSKYGRRKGTNVYTAKGTEQYIQENLFAKLTPDQKSNMEIWSMDFTEQKIKEKKYSPAGSSRSSKRSW